MKKQMKDLGVNVVFNTEFVAADAVDFDEVFVATGAAERKLSTHGFDNENVVYAIDNLLNKDIRDEKVVIVGAGLTGCEIAYDLALKNCDVTVVEMENTKMVLHMLLRNLVTCQTPEAEPATYLFTA
ncbi:MAG: FAD-dependent oxidoreductase [Schaedlerella sp.]|nr:FAD-dependent oxidoreductase [Schaedlerella sp.]